MDMDSRVKGQVSAINITSRGLQINGYHSRFSHIHLNDVLRDERVSAREGEMDFRDALYLRSAAIEEVTRNITKSSGDPRFTFEFNELWPVIVSTSKIIQYHGSGINDREIVYNNQDFVQASNFMCTDLDKTSMSYLELERMNATVVAIGSSIESVNFLPTKTTRYAISEDTTGTTDLEYTQIAPDQKTVLNAFNERFQGTFAINVTVNMSLNHLKTLDDAEVPSLDCCASK